MTKNKLQQIKHIFFNSESTLRMGWTLLFGVGGYYIVMFCLYWGLSAIFGALFEAWNLTTTNLMRAPLWAQFIVAWHSNFADALAYVVPACLLLWLAKCPKTVFQARWVGRSVLAGIGIAAGLTAVALLSDSLRMEWPLWEPLLHLGQPIGFVLLLLGRWNSEVLSKQFVFTKVRVHWGRGWAYLGATVLTFVLYAPWSQNVSYMVNAVLLGIVSCALFERGGLWASMGFQASWTIWASEIFAFPNVASTTRPVYALYHVSDAWLTGGNNGPMSGLWMTLWLCLLAGVLFRTPLYMCCKRVLQIKKKGNAMS